MCDVNKTRFFRPWNGDGAVAEDEETNDLEKSVTIDATTDDNTMDREVNERVNVKFEELTMDEEDNESVTSSLSGATSETGSYERRRSDNTHRNKKLDRRQSVSSSCSVNSCEDLPEPGSLDMLSNFVFGTRSEVETARSTIENSIVNSNSSSASEASSCASRNSPKSAFTPTNYQCPVYTALDYFSPLGMVTPENAVVAAAAAASFEATYSSPHHHHHHQQLMYGLPGINLGTYANSVEEAVKYIHQQDAAAKQMKKLRPKKFRCEHCDVAFSNNGQLKGHVRIHTGERPFKCDAEGCGKSFTRNEELTRHKRIHTGLRPHSCVLCGKRFGRKDHLKKHTRTHDNRAAYHIPASALGPYALSHHALSQGHPMASYMYPI